MNTTINASSDGTALRRRGSRTGLLRAGMIAGPLFAAVSFAQIPFRDGFDMTRHAFSFLLIGQGGWLQQVNFLVAGSLYAAASIGLRKVLGGKTGIAAQCLATGLGGGLIIAGLFRPPPSFGYPAGAPSGAPAHVTIGAVMHGVGFGLGVLSLCGLLLVLAAWLWRRRQRRWAAAALATAVALLTVPPTSGQSWGTVWLYVAVTASYCLTSALLAHLRTTTDA